MLGDLAADEVRADSQQRPADVPDDHVGPARRGSLPRHIRQASQYIRVLPGMIIPWTRGVSSSIQVTRGLQLRLRFVNQFTQGKIHTKF
jgi:hypothetical protein